MKEKLAVIGIGTLAVLFGVPTIRRSVISRAVMNSMRRLGLLPQISETEKEAIEAGTVWVDGELFSGKPDLGRLMAESYPDLTDEERKFMDGPVEEVCRMTNDWEVWQKRDLPLEVWDYLKKERFFGMIIPSEYGGLGFSASANSAVVAKLAARSQVLGITVMVPNSLGPAELLIHYGTPDQKSYYLPRLARGEEIPCFALTEPGAGSDAGSITASGVVFKADDNQLKIRLNWNKRYITLASVSTLLGLAFKLNDRENLLGKGVKPGITCALIPTSTEGVDVSLRHDPMGVPFINCPTTGKDVIIPVSAIIGGADGAGRGWRMLMESLAAGRGISLPALSTGNAKLAYRVVGAHAAVRKQFGLSIGKFEGIEEPLARIGGLTYLLEAARKYTCGGLDKGAKPPVVTAIMKFNATEIARNLVNDGMDVLGGSGISRGPHNAIASAYMGTPIAITVEGANILTRTLMIFGQGAIRCHPFVLKEVEALENGNLKDFDSAFWGHVLHVVANTFRSAFMSISRGYLASTRNGATAKYIRKLAWASASFALLSDVALISLGGSLKRKEKLSGRFADILSWMYLATAALKRYEAEGNREDDRPFFEWSMDYAFERIQNAFDGLFQNLNVPVLGPLLRGPVALWSRLNPISTGPEDKTGHLVAKAMQVPGSLRDRHTDGIFVSEDPNEAIGRMERALILNDRAEPIEKKLKDAVRTRSLPRTSPAELVKLALANGIISKDEARLVREAEEARNSAIQVAAYTQNQYFSSAVRESDPEIEDLEIPENRSESIIGVV